MDIKKRMKETFSLLEEVDLILMEEYKNILNFELTPKQSLIVQLVHKKPNSTVQEIANFLQMSKSSVSQLLSKLEKEKYIQR